MRYGAREAPPASGDSAAAFILCLAVAVVAVGMLLISAAAARALPPPPSLSFVPDRGTGSGAACGGEVRCVGPSGAYRTIGAAVAAAANGDTIQVEAGTYPERVVVAGKRVVLRGGFAAGFARRNPAANRTVIDAGGGGTTVSLSGAGDSVVDGFTITGGRAPLDADGNARGSGIRVEDSGAVTISHNVIERNDDGQDFRTCNCATVGGGIDVSGYRRESTVAVRGNIIRGNRAHRGAAVAIGVNAVIVGNLVEDNRAGGDHGGGLYLSAAKITVRRNLIRGNRVGDQAGYGWGGGAIFYGPGDPTPRARFESNRWVANSAPSVGSGLFIDEDASAKIVGDLFHDNACGGTGGAAIYVDGTGVAPSGSLAKIENVTITDHACRRDRRGSAIFTEGGSRIAMSNSIITANGGSSQVYVCTDCQELPRPKRSTIAWSLVGGATVNVERGQGVKTGAPRFVDPAANDFRLAPRSKAIDAADPKSPVGSEPRPNGGRRNIGAYGGTRQATRSARRRSGRSCCR